MPTKWKPNTHRRNRGTTGRLAYLVDGRYDRGMNPPPLQYRSTELSTRVGRHHVRRTYRFWESIWHPDKSFYPYRRQAILWGILKQLYAA